MGFSGDNFEPGRGASSEPTPAADASMPADASHGASGMGAGAADTVGEVAGDTGTQRQLDEQRDRYLRLAAEYDNFRKRSQRERQEAHARGQADLVKSLIEALDDLSRFAHVDPSTTDAATVVEGAAMVEKKLFKALSSAGLEVVNPVDQTFDPAHHEAVSTEPAAAREDDHVVSRVYQSGYLFNGQLLRPARVVVRQWNG